MVPDVSVCNAVEASSEHSLSIVLWALEREIEPEEEIVYGCLGQE